jgi:valyl-tRNA synthetase
MELPKSYEPRSIEEKWYSWWEERGYFHAGVEQGRSRYCITIPPPNVTGELHMGHALQHSIHDVLVRLRRMQGHNTLCLPGTDHAGIATQMKAEQELWELERKNRRDVGREEMLRRIWTWTEKYGGTILKQLRALGCSYDWQRTSFTLDEGYHRAVLEAFVRFYRRGWIYRGERMVNWCPLCQTVISDLEVEEIPAKGFLWYIRYPILEGNGDVVVATTRPETMLGDTAVAVHPEDERWKPYIGRRVLLPLMRRSLPIVADEYADPEMGSGAVKVTPAHDPNDYEVGLRHSLSLVKVIGEDGRMTQDAGRFAGLDRFEARAAVLKALEEERYLVKRDQYEYNIPTHDKCATPIEPLLKEQWFMDMKQLARSTIPVLQREEIKYFPDRFRNYSIEWLANIRDWTLSRQIWWGHRIPVWSCQGCGEQMVQVSPPTACSKCQGGVLDQDPDVLDTWFSSALWPFATLGWPRSTQEMDYFFPTDLLITGREILYLWVARMIMTSLDFVGKIPFRHVLIHPTILTKDGRRMSKSLGTGIDPLELIRMYGADATRFALLYQCTGTQDVRFDADVKDNKVLRSLTAEMCRNFANKVWNASRFVFMNLDHWDQPVNREKLPPREELEPVDRWILHRLNETIRGVTDALESYRFDDYSQQLYGFIWNEFCDWYVEMAKLRLYGNDAKGQARVRRILVFLTDHVLRLLHPGMPFLTEELWQILPHAGESIMLVPWPEPHPSLVDGEAAREIQIVMEAVRAVRNLRAEAGLRDRTVRIVAQVHDAAVSDALARNERHLHVLARVEAWDTQVGDGKRPRHSLATAIPGADIFLPLEGLVDLEQERKRLENEIAKVKKDLELVETALKNRDFLDKAAPQVVERKQESRRDLSARHARLLEWLKAVQEEME